MNNTECGRLEKNELIDLPGLLELCSPGNPPETKKDEFGNVFVTKIPSFSKEKYILGIDEAGRGPIAGPLVFTVIFWPQSLLRTEFRDSKQVSSGKRETLFKSMLADPEVGILQCAISPLYISINMLNNKRDQEQEKEKKRVRDLLRPKKGGRKTKEVVLGPGPTTAAETVPASPYKEFLRTTALLPNLKGASIYRSGLRMNLNQLSVHIVCQLISQNLPQNISIAIVYMDLVGNALDTEQSLRAAIKNRKRKNPEHVRIIVEPKADSAYRIVGAASIASKHLRDMFIYSAGTREAIYGIVKNAKNMGSGYPSDSRTRNWLQSVMCPITGFPSIVRSSWIPALQMLQSYRPARSDLVESAQVRGALRCQISIEKKESTAEQEGAVKKKKKKMI